MSSKDSPSLLLARAPQLEFLPSPEILHTYAGLYTETLPRGGGGANLWYGKKRGVEADNSIV